MELIFKPWAWYVAGPIIACVLFLLVKVGKRFGMSSNLDTMCSMAGASKWSSHFKPNWKENTWSLVLIAGVFVGGLIAFQYLNVTPPQIEESVATELNNLGFASVNNAYAPLELFSLEGLSNPKSILILLLAGFLVGFGARYAGGCTSGHAISGLSNLQLPSLLAVIGFFIGGLLMVHVLIPLIF